MEKFKATQEEMKNFQATQEEIKENDSRIANFLELKNESEKEASQFG